MRAVLGGAWRTIVPASGDRHGPLPPLLLALTVVTGLVDAVSYLLLGHVFVANMTGNVVFLGFALAGAQGFSVGASLTALGAFAVGAAAGGRIAGHLRHRGRALFAGLLVETVLLAAAAAVVAGTGTGTGGGARYAVTAMMAAALGAQNAVVRALGVPDLTTTVLTMTITGMFADPAGKPDAGAATGRRLLAVLAMLGGAVLGGVLVLHASETAAVAAAPVALLVITALVAGRRRSTEPWTHLG